MSALGPNGGENDDNSVVGANLTLQNLVPGHRNMGSIQMSDIDSIRDRESFRGFEGNRQYGVKAWG
jgi:hypothetical protein